MDVFKQYLDAYLKLFPDGEYRLDEPMREHTSFRIGGEAPVMFFPRSGDEIAELKRLAADMELNPLVMGNGTNLLVTDDKLGFPVIVTSENMKEIKLVDGETIEAQSGVLLSVIAGFALKQGLGGMEFAHGIPGSLGGAVSMNAGAYGGEMKDIVMSSAALCGNEIKEFRGDENGFSYRRSRYTDTDDTVLSAVIRLKPGDSGEIRAKMDELSAKRRASQPLNMPSAGSTFKRPVGGYAAALIEQAGLKGYSVGGAQVSEKHSGFVVNRGGATFEDVLRLMDHVRETVYKTSGIELEPEVKIIRN